MTILSPDSYGFSFTALPTAAAGLLILAFGIVVLRRRVSRVSASFFALTLFAAIWFLTFTFMYLADDGDTALFWARAGYLGVPFLPAAVYQFTVEMLRIAAQRRVLLIASWGAGIVFSLLATTTDVILDGVVRFSWGYYPSYRAVSSLPFLLYFGVVLAGSLWEFVRALGRSRGIEQVRIRLLITSFGIAYAGCVDFFPKYGIDIFPLGFLPILGFVAVVAHAVRRYDLVPITPLLAAKEIISTMADAVFVCDRDGRIQFANTAAESLLGFPSGDLEGTAFEELISPASAEVSKNLRRKSIRSAEYEFVNAAGERVDMTLSIAPVMRQNEVTGAVIIGRDMRERKRAEREVQRALALLRATLDSTADGILVVGDDGRILEYNHRFVEMWRIPDGLIEARDEALIMAYVVDQLSRPDDFSRTVEALTSEPDAESFELLEFRDGRRFDCYSIGTRIGSERRVRVWSFRDVTARFTAESALRESEARYRLLFEQNAAGVYVTSQKGRILDCNSTFAIMMGYPRAELMGRAAADLYERPIERDELTSLLLDAGSLTGVEIELRRKDAGRVWVLQNLVLVGGATDGVVHATVVDISDRKRAEEQIEFHAYHDVLTHLPNRRLFVDRLGQTLNRARRSGRPFAVFFIDLDHFKSVNDTLGHNAGDELLLEMSIRLKTCVREEDTVARLGGDEFTIILAELRQPEDAAQVAQKVLDAVEQPISIGESKVEVSASVGIAIYPQDGATVEALLRSADTAMYRAKESGRNNYQLCTDDLRTRTVERLLVQSRLRKAISMEELTLHYQPQVSLATGDIVGLEALVRWNDPERGLVEPDAFIPLAEESRLIIPIGEWVMRNACAQAREWRDAGLGPIRIAVNLSARQFQQNDLAASVRRVIEETGIEPQMLELEITETVAMQDAELSVRVLEELREIGVAISIDDFGTGYSSLSYLKQFPISAVKIDRSFVSGVGSSEGDRAIVTAVIGIARSLHIRVVAEGVETEQQAQFLRERACEEAQGFYFSRPLPAASMTGKLARGVRAGVRS